MQTILLGAFGIPELLLVVLVVGIGFLLITLVVNNSKNRMKDEKRQKGRKEEKKRWDE